MKTKITAILFLSITFVAKAGDTIFSSPPNTREWNPTYLQQKFVDEFNGSTLNGNFWDIDLCRSRGYKGNNEGEPNNITVSNGTLKLTARYSPGNVDNNCSDNSHFISDYTTAEVWSKWNNYRYKYGSFEAQCFIPRGDHYYYAYWLWGPGGSGYPQDGFTSEIDIAEGCAWSDGTHHNMKSTFHLWPQTGGDQVSLPDDASFGYGTGYEGAWHNYKIVWNPYEVIFYIDSNEVWRRSKYYTGSDIIANDVGMNQIQANVTYHKRDWFPNDEMITIFQMHVTKGIVSTELPASMEVNYVKIKQFFIAPEITVPSQICSTGTATMNVDPLASNITWQITPSNLVVTSSGTGLTANIAASSTASGTGTITYTFSMPSGETFTASKSFWVGLTASFTGNTTVLSGGSGTWNGTATCGTPPYNYEWFLREDDGSGAEGVLVGTGSSLTLWSVPRSSKAVSLESEVSEPVTMQQINSTIYYLYLRASDANNRVYYTQEKQIVAYGDVDLINPMARMELTKGENTSALQLKISPNPASNETTIEINDTGIQDAKSNTEWQVEVYDSMQSLKAKAQKITGKQYAISTVGWKEGVYLVRAKFGNEILSGKLMVKP